MTNESALTRFAQVSDLDFERLSWHDCHIWGIAFRSGEPSENDWISELILDIDFICEWCCDIEEGRSLAIALRHAESSLAGPLSIAEISRTPEGTTSRWRIALNWPARGEITFVAVGFKQTLRAEPVLIEEQCFRLDEREKLVGP